MDELSSLPNWHPAVVHFPIALAMVALALDGAAVVLKRLRWLDMAGTLLWLLAALAAVAAWGSGHLAEDSLGRLAPAAQAELAEHSDLGRNTMFALLLMAAARLAVRWRERHAEATPRGAARLALLGGGLAVAGLVAETAEHGGALVYRHGVAVATPVPPAAPAPAPAAALGSSVEPQGLLERTGDGGLLWRPRAGDRQRFVELLEASPGAPAAVIRIDDRAEPGEGLALAVAGRAVLLLPGGFDDVELAATVDLSAFHGRFGLVHHYRDAEGGAFVLGPQGRVDLLRLLATGETVLDGRTAPRLASRVELAASVVGRHLKGMLDGRLVAHAHFDFGPAARAGLLFDGEGTVRLLELSARPIGTAK